MTTGNDFYGPFSWDFLHTVCANFMPGQERDILSLIDLYGKLYPCEHCRKHFNERKRDIDPRKYMKNGREMLMWSYLMHDMVNIAKLKNNIPGAKPSPPFVEIEKKFREGLLKSDLTNTQKEIIKPSITRTSTLTIIPSVSEIKSKPPPAVRTRNLAGTNVPPPQQQPQTTIFSALSTEPKKVTTATAAPKRAGCARCGDKKVV